MTGVNLFQSIHLPRSKHGLGIDGLPSVLSSRKTDMVWVYDKTEDMDPSNPDEWRHFSHLISDDDGCHVPSLFERLHQTAFVQFDGLAIRPPVQWLSSLPHAPAICLRAGLLQPECLDAMLPFYFRWRDSVWLCRRSAGE